MVPNKGRCLIVRLCHRFLRGVSSVFGQTIEVGRVGVRALADSTLNTHKHMLVCLVILSSEGA